MSEFLMQNWGNIASVAGLGISVWVLFVATKAKQAAQDARSAARLKSLAEVLEETANRILQVGIFLRDRKWDMVQLRAQEVSNHCWQASARWGDQLPRTIKSSLMEAARISSSIAGSAMELSMQQLDEEKWRRALDSCRDASRLISTVLGEARKAEERTRQ